MARKSVLFVFIDWFDPAYKGGGPIRSVTNLVNSLQNSHEIYVFTSDRDMGDTIPIPNILADKWIAYGTSAHVYYASPSMLNWKNILLELRLRQPDCIYCNSMFSKYFALYPLLMKRYGLIKADLVLAPKGMLRPSALRFKRFKKQLFLALFRVLRIHSFIRFHATDEDEKQCIENVFGKVTVFCVLDSPAPLPASIVPVKKEPGTLQLLFVGRIHPIKQLDYLLNLLTNQTASIDLAIAGTIEDQVYWDKCRELIKLLPASVRVKYLGEVPHHQLHSVFNQHHIFALPTMGENFGHAIYEAFGSGRPVLISNQTPWKNLAENKAGWEFSLQQPEYFSAALSAAAEWDQKTFDAWSAGAKNYVTAYFNNNDQVAAYRQLFN